MELIRWMGRWFARFVAVSVVLVNVQMFALNLADRGWDPLVHIWIVAAALSGISGGVLYLMAIDGPVRFRTRAFRVWGWALMLFAVALPTSLTLLLAPMVLILLPSVLMTSRDQDDEAAITSE